jgi:NAD dependent epimerase/dehydratase family enzyme
MAIILLKGVKASNQKITSTGFVFQYKSLSDALGQLLGKTQ